MNISVDQVMAWHPREDMTRDRILAVTRGRESLDAKDVSLLPLPPQEILWVLLRPDVIEAPALRELCAKMAEHVLGIFEGENPEDRRPRQAIEAGRAYNAGGVGKAQLADAREGARAAAGEHEDTPAGQSAFAAAFVAAEDMTAFIAESCARAAAEAVPAEIDERAWQLAMVREALGVEDPKPDFDGPISLRLAKDEEGDRVGHLVSTLNGFAFETFDLDWSRIFPHWILAEIDDYAVGAVQVCPGKPLGRIELLCTEPTLSKRQKGRVVRALMGAAEETLFQQDSQIAAGVIPLTMKGYKRVAQRRGWRTLSTGNLMARRLR